MSAAGATSPAAAPAASPIPAGCDRDDGEFGGRVGVRQAAAKGAAGADGGVTDPAGGLGEQRVLALRGERAVPGQGADPQAAAGFRADRGQAGDAVDVDEDA